MRRAAVVGLAGLVLLAGCKKDPSSSESEEEGEPFIPLTTTDQRFESDGESVQDTCDDADIDFEDLDIQFDQIATGLSIFLDPDIGWVPCEGDIEAFVCSWGNAPADTTESTWSWTFTGTTDGDRLEATLRLEITCGRDSEDCEPCVIESEVQGRID